MIDRTILFLDGAVMVRADAALVRADAETHSALVRDESSILTPRTVEKRRREFLLGRAAARQALVQLGASPSAILTGSDREPIWPAGIVGSISHSGGCCLAVVGRSDRFQSLGLDVEDNAPLKPELVKMVLTEDERARASDWTGLGVDVGKLTFSAKEAFYKAYFPLAKAEALASGVAPDRVFKRVFLDFADVELVFEPEARRFTAHVVNVSKTVPDACRKMHGRFAVDTQWVYTGVSM